MQYQFDTSSPNHGAAALILYAMFKSRDKNSPLNGLDTWNRFGTFMRAACLKSRTTPEFVQEFCHKAKIQSVKPKYLSDSSPYTVPGTGEVIFSADIKNYQLQLIDDNNLMPIFEKESQYLIMLVRERIQREKMEGAPEYDEEEN